MAKLDWEKVIAEFRSSGLSQAEFARQRGVATHRLSYQLQRTEQKGSFVRVSSEQKVELELANGILLKVTEEQLPAVIRALRTVE
jgi:hypothetical protein